MCVEKTNEIRSIKHHHNREPKKKTLPVLGRSNWINETINMNPSTKNKDTNLTEANKYL